MRAARTSQATPKTEPYNPAELSSAESIRTHLSRLHPIPDQAANSSKGEPSLDVRSSAQLIFNSRRHIPRQNVLLYKVLFSSPLYVLA